MSETSKAWAKVCADWSNLSFEDKMEGISYFAGCSMIGAAIIGVFGLWGAVFDVGLLLWLAGRA